MEAELKFVIPALLGVESLVAREVKKLGLAEVRAENGRVLCSGGLGDIPRLNLNLRVGARVLLCLGEFEARSFEELFEGAAALPRVFPIRLSASALVVGALGFFLCLALKTERETARGGTPAARRSACTNLWASLFVFLAALLRLDDLLGTRDASGEVI